MRLRMAEGLEAPHFLHILSLFLPVWFSLVRD